MINRVKIEYQRLPLGVPDGIEWLSEDLRGVNEPYKVDESGRLWYKDLFKTMPRWELVEISRSILVYATIDNVRINLRLNFSDNTLISLIRL